MSVPYAADRRLRPILIFGAPRAGTSLLSRLLNAHSRISIPFESHLFNQWLPRLGAYGSLDDPGNRRRLVSDIVEFGVIRDWPRRPAPVEILKRVRGQEFGHIARAFLDWWAETEGKPRWGEKTPHHTLLHRTVLSTWSDALVLIIVRDPRDVALSWKEARFGGDHVFPFARAWREYVDACTTVKASLSDDAVHMLRYEDLVDAPEAELRCVMTFLGESFEPAQLGFHRQKAAAWHTDDRNRQRLQTPVSSESVGRWRRGLSETEVMLIEMLAGDAMRQHGYSTCSAPRQLARLECLFHSRLAPAIRRVTGLRKNRQGLVYLSRDLRWHLQGAWRLRPRFERDEVTS